MSNYLSRLAVRTGLLNQAQGAIPGTVAGIQKGQHALQQHLEIQNEYATIKAPGSAEPDIGSITQTSAHVETPTPPLSSVHHEDKTEPHLSGITPEYSSKANVQYPIGNHEPNLSGITTENSSQPNTQYLMENHEPHLAEPRMTVAVDRVENDPSEVKAPLAESKQIDLSNQSVTTGSDFSVPVAQTNERLADDSGNINQSRVVLHNDALDTFTMETDNTSPPEDKRSNVFVVKTNPVEQLVSDPLARVLESKPANKITRTDSNQARQYGETISGQQFKQKADNQSQINIQSITLEVHQSESARIPAPAPVPRNHAPAPNQNAPSQTRLSRYYLKGW